MEEYGIEPTSFAEIRPGCYDIHERVRDMDANGVIASMCFPSFPQLCGQLFAKASDPDLGLAVLRAYNDWHIDEWCGTYPGRFIPLSLAAHLGPRGHGRRGAAGGGQGLSRRVVLREPGQAEAAQLPHATTGTRSGRPAADEGTIVCLHIGSSSSLVVTAPDAPIDVLIWLQPVNIVQAAADLLWSPVLRKFPDLRVSLSEGGIGWIPYFLDRMDWIYTRHHGWTGPGLRGQAARAEVFAEQVVTLLHRRPRRRSSCATGWGWTRSAGRPTTPTPTRPGPVSPETLMASLDGVPDDEIERLTHRNAMRHFRFDPFVHRPKEECTVGALRAGAADVDVTPRPPAGRASRGPRMTKASDLTRHPGTNR